MRPEDVPAELVALAMQGWRTPRMHINTEPERTEARLRDVLAAVLPEIQAQALLGARAELQAAYRRGPGSRLDGLESTWRKGMAKAHRIVRDYQDRLTDTKGPTS